VGVLPDWMIETGVKIVPMERCESRPGKISYGLTSYGYDARVGYRFRVFSPINAQVIDPKSFDPKALVEVDLHPGRHNWEFSRAGFDDERVGVWKCLMCGANGGPNLSAADQSSVCPKSDVPAYILIPPHSFVLAETMEWFEIPRDCLAIVLGKSTYARCGLVVNCTPLEPEWKGRVTVELSNTTPLPMKVYCGEGIMQVYFLRSDGRRDVHEFTTAEFMRVVAAGMATHHAALEARKMASRAYENNQHTCRTSYADKKGKYQDQNGIELPRVEGA